MGQSLFESNWYLLQYEIQKFYVLMIANAQLPVSYHGMNVVDLNLERFTKVNFLSFNIYYLIETIIQTLTLTTKTSFSDIKYNNLVLFSL